MRLLNSVSLFKLFLVLSAEGSRVALEVGCRNDMQQCIGMCMGIRKSKMWKQCATLNILGFFYILFWFLVSFPVWPSGSWELPYAGQNVMDAVLLYTSSNIISVKKTFHKLHLGKGAHNEAELIWWATVTPSACTSPSNTDWITSSE